MRAASFIKTKTTLTKLDCQSGPSIICTSPQIFLRVFEVEPNKLNSMSEPSRQISELHAYVKHTREFVAKMSLCSSYKLALFKVCLFSVLTNVYCQGKRVLSRTIICHGHSLFGLATALKHNTHFSLGMHTYLSSRYLLISTRLWFSVDGLFLLGRCASVFRSIEIFLDFFLSWILLSPFIYHLRPPTLQNWLN